jgi:hypothetical protein
MDEPRELTVEELEAEEIGELPDREALSLLRPSALHPLLSLPLPEVDPGAAELPSDVGPPDDAGTANR